MGDNRVRIFEVGPRDGLQNESVILDVDRKVEMIERLVETGVRDIEFGSFVHPKWVPQMAETEEVARRITRRDGVRYWGLVPNLVGLERALEAGTTHIATFMSASETHNQHNVNRTVQESLDCLKTAYETATAEDVTIRAYVSTAFGCPYEGDVSFDRVLSIAETLLAQGADMIALGDTIGAGTPAQVREGARRAIEAFGADRVAMHLHDTQGMGLANALAAYQAGIRIFDASVGATGGCPYAPGAAGNIATEEMVHMFDGMDIETDIDRDGLLHVAQWIDRETDIDLPSKLYRYQTQLDADDDQPEEARATA
jgi:hydroxymethylglutaryl-CoA lyase